MDTDNLDEEDRPGTKDIRIALQLNISLCQAKKLDFLSQHKTCSKVCKVEITGSCCLLYPW